MMYHYFGQYQASHIRSPGPTRTTRTWHTWHICRSSDAYDRYRRQWMRNVLISVPHVPIAELSLWRRILDCGAGRSSRTLSLIILPFPTTRRSVVSIPKNQNDSLSSLNIKQGSIGQHKHTVTLYAHSSCNGRSPTPQTTRTNCNMTSI